jgi:hypothetical protein
MKIIERSDEAAVESIFADAKTCLLYALNNDYQGEEITFKHARTLYKRWFRSRFYDNEDGTYTLRHDDRMWLIFR